MGVWRGFHLDVTLLVPKGSALCLVPTASDWGGSGVVRSGCGRFRVPEGFRGPVAFGGRLPLELRFGDAQKEDGDVLYFPAPLFSTQTSGPVCVKSSLPLTMDLVSPRLSSSIRWGYVFFFFLAERGTPVNRMLDPKTVPCRPGASRKTVPKSMVQD